MKKTWMIAVSCFLALMTLAAGVIGIRKQTEDSGEQDYITVTNLKLNTVVTVSVYDSEDRALLTECMDICDKYENILSRTKEGSELYRLNHRQLALKEGTTDTYLISQELAEVISAGLSFTRDSDGAFNIAIAPLTSLWDFQAENPSVPDPSDVSKAIGKCGYEEIRLEGQEITLPSRDTQFDLGGIAKGYIADKIKEYLVSRGVHSALINLGGNVVCVGAKSEGTPFEIGIQKPFADRNETIAVMEIADRSVVSSGIYERCFEKDGTLYHHILNPNTGYPYENDLVSVTVVTDKSMDGDALSTTCFSLGAEKGLAYAESFPDVQAVFITRDYEILYTENFREKIHVRDSMDGTLSQSKKTPASISGE